MKKKVLLTTLALALMIQSSVMAEATHKHIWEDDIKNSNETINRYTCKCGATKDEVIADIRDYVITFNANGGYVGEPEKETYKGRIKWLPIPEHTSDYQWEGWFTEPEGGELVDNTWIYEEDTTLYAQWTLKGTRTLTFACDGGSYIRPITRKLGETVDLAGYVPEKQGYIFKGWYEDPRTKENEVTEYTFNGNGVLYAKWEADPTKEQPDTLMTTDTIYLTDEQYYERISRIQAIIEELIERYLNTKGASKGAPFSMSWRNSYGK